MKRYVHPSEFVQSGDLLAWSSPKIFSLSQLPVEFIRMMTRSEYAHVGVAWRLESRLFVVEATIPNVRLVPVRDNSSYYHIPARINWSRASEEFLLGKIGLRYSMIDGIRAYFGQTTLSDDRWQCAELAAAFYKSHDVELDIEKTTPSGVVQALCRARNSYIRPVFF